ncbi:MAG: hypothetical protein K6E26_04375 [Clostridiales bacterium]|nr:hypothetical protein [Clostridiales bacterium]
MIDIHSHVLPGIDDGSKSAEMSVQMLRESRRQGVEWMCFTPHFYADMMDPATFLQRRKAAEELLIAEMKEPGIAFQNDPEVNGSFPGFILGSEVHYYRGIGRSEDIRSLCLGKSSFFLLEPPFRDWTGAFLEDVRTLRDELDLRVIIAHIERYLDQDKRLVREILDEPGIYIQSNAEAFIDRKTRKKVMKLLQEEKIDFLGTDCHNMTYRPPNMLDAWEIIEDKLGSGALERLEDNSFVLIERARG